MKKKRAQWGRRDGTWHTGASIKDKWHMRRGDDGAMCTDHMILCAPWFDERELVPYRMCSKCIAAAAKRATTARRKEGA